MSHLAMQLQHVKWLQIVNHGLTDSLFLLIVEKDTLCFFLPVAVDVLQNSST